jgi:hypothetical protein
MTATPAQYQQKVVFSLHKIRTEWSGARAFRQEQTDFQSTQLVGEPFDSQMGHTQKLPEVGG